MKKKIIAGIGVAALSMAMLPTAAPAALAATVPPQPTAHYDMAHDGTSLLDVSGNNRHATLVDVPADAFTAYSGGEALKLATNGYASLPQGLVSGTDNDFAVEITLGNVKQQNHFAWVIGDGVGAWNTWELGNYVFINPKAGDWGGELLSGIRVKTDGGNGEIRAERTGARIVEEEFNTITLSSTGQDITIYINGEPATTIAHSYSMADVVPAGDVFGYLGRSLYSPDPLFDGTILDVKFWDEALTAEQVAASTMPAAERASVYTEIFTPENFTDLILEQLLGENPDAATITTNLTPPASVEGFALTWTTSDPDVIAADGSVVRPTDADVTVTMTATDNNGNTYPFDVTVKAISQDSRAQADLDAISISNVTTENLPLIAEGTEFGSTITWTSSDPALVTPTDPAYQAPAVGAADPFAGAGIVDRPAYGTGDATVTLTATVTNGDVTLTKDFTVVVKEQGRSAPDAGYAAAYFKADNNERIYMDHTTENNFFTFEPSNGGEPVLVSTTDDKGLRDPYILRSVNGDKYYMVATDLCVSCGGYDWGRYQQWGSLKIHVWESTDLVNWTRTTDHDGALTVNQPAAGMTWAPEAFWDDELQSYVVHFASRIYDDAAHTQTDWNARMFYVLTRDFKTFTYPPVEWQNTEGARIDSTLIKVDDNYYRFTKAESGDDMIPSKDIFLEKSSVLTAPTTTVNPNADPTQTWQLLDSGMTTPYTGNHGEGPQIIKLNEGDPNNDGNDYLLLVDNYGAGGYRPFKFDGDALTSSDWGNRLSQQADWAPMGQEGLPESPRHGAFVSAPQAILDAMTTWSSIAPVESTTALTVTDRTVDFTVTAADGGDVVGTATVTFVNESGETWTQTVNLVDKAGSVTIPGTEAGTVTVTYDGYTDGLVLGSEATGELTAVVIDEPTDEPTVEPTEEPTVEPTDEPTVEPTDEPTVEPTTPAVTPVDNPPATKAPADSLPFTGVAAGGLAALALLLMAAGFALRYTNKPAEH